MALNRAQVALNLIRTMGSDAYKNSVPALTESTPISTVWNVFTSQPLVYKEFTQLFGAFMELEVEKNAWDNPLGELIVSGSPLGEFSAVVASNPAQPRPYDPAHPERVLQYAMSDDKVVYYARNIKEFFKVSFAYHDMQGAFESYGKFDEYMSTKLATLESGKQISSYNHMMESLVVNYYSGVFVESDVHISPETTNYAEWTTAVKNAYDEMQFPSYNYNKYGSLEGANGDFKAWSKADDIYILATIKWMNADNVNFLASVFNLEKAEIAKKIVKVPEFGYDAYDDEGNFVTHISSPIQAVVIDRRALKYKNDLDLDTSNWNEETLVSNYWKHFWATYQINPLAQALVFTTPASANTDQNTNFYEVMYNRPSVTTYKNNTANSITLSFTNSTANRFAKGANGVLVTDDFSDYQSFSETDYSPETVEEAGTLLALYTLAVNTTVQTNSETAVDGVSTPDSLTLASGETGTIKVSRTVNTNNYKAGKYVLVEASGDDAEISFVISDEMMAQLRATYGSNIICGVDVSADANAEPVTVFVGVKNAI